MRPLIPCALMVCALATHPVLAQSPGQSTQPAQAQPIRYMDLTSRQDGWGASQLAATQASRNNKVVIISYLDPQTTRALYDAALPFTQSPTNLPIVGLIRSPAAPQSVTVTPNPLGFDIFFNGSVIPPMEKPDPRFTRTDQLSAFMRGIHRNYFAAATAEGGCFDIKREPDPKTGGLRIPEQRVCPPFKPASP